MRKCSPEYKKINERDEVRPQPPEILQPVCGWEDKIFEFHIYWWIGAESLKTFSESSSLLFVLFFAPRKTLSSKLFLNP